MPTIHRQLRDWCRRRGYQACEAFASRLDEELRSAPDLTPDTLLTACRRVGGTWFFRENQLDSEVVAQQLSEYLKLPPLQTNLKKFTPDDPNTPRDLGNPSEDPPHLFLSYYHEDLAFVEDLGSRLAKKGFAVWYDKRGLSAGESFPHRIEWALSIANHIGVVCTPTSLDRPWVRKEIDAGHYREGKEGGNILIPVLLKECDLPALLAPKSWCDFTMSFDDGLQELVEALAA